MTKKRLIEELGNAYVAQFARVYVAEGFPKQELQRHTSQKQAFGIRHDPILNGSSHAFFGRSISA
eukprot:scaffold139_cov325-Pavlova_lutheri.AAC.11